MLTDVRPSALLALSAHPPMLTDARPSASLAPVAPPTVLTDTRPSAFLAMLALSTVLATLHVCNCRKLSSWAEDAGTVSGNEL